MTTLTLGARVEQAVMLSGGKAIPVARMAAKHQERAARIMLERCTKLSPMQDDAPAQQIVWNLLNRRINQLSICQKIGRVPEQNRSYGTTLFPTRAWMYDVLNHEGPLRRPIELTKTLDSYLEPYLCAIGMTATFELARCRSHDNVKLLSWTPFFV